MQSDSFGRAIQTIGTVITMVAVISGWISLWLTGGVEKRFKAWMLTKDGKFFMAGYLDGLGYTRNESKHRRRSDDEDSDNAN